MNEARVNDPGLASYPGERIGRLPDLTPRGSGRLTGLRSITRLPSRRVSGDRWAANGGPS